MTVITELAVRRPGMAGTSRAAGTGICAACRLALPAASLEPVPTRPHLARCKDAAACCERFRPRPLASSLGRVR